MECGAMIRRSRGSCITPPAAATRRIMSRKSGRRSTRAGSDQGWDRLREETFERQKRLRGVPADAELRPRDAEMPAWDSLSENSKRLFAHQMEVYAGYSENADHHVGRLLDAIEEMGELENTVIIWI